MYFAEDHFCSALSLMGEGNKEAALHQLQAGLLLKDDVSAWANRGTILAELGYHFEAMLSLDRAILMRPDVPEFHTNRALVMRSLLKMEEASLSCDRALNINPSYDIALSNKALICSALGKFNEAVDLYRKAVEVVPDSDEYHMFLGMALLRVGEFKEGWKEYERRYTNKGHKVDRWNGERGVNLVIKSEQGQGDILQFIRYAPIVKEMFDCKVYIESRPYMKRLMESIPVDGILDYGERHPGHIQKSVSVLSLPYFCETDDINKIPNQVPYFSVSKDRIETWEKLIHRPQKQMRIGVCWGGLNLEKHHDSSPIYQRRSMNLTDFAPLCGFPVTWISLQKGPSLSQIRNPPRGMTIGGWPDEMQDFYDTAALIECCDLVITIDTSVAHLAGAMGKNTWLLLCKDACWRWMSGEYSPWYPTMRLFRQREFGNWKSVIDQVGNELAMITRLRVA